MNKLNYNKLDRIIYELQDGSHLFVGEIAEFLIKNDVTTLREVAYLAEVLEFPKTRVMDEIKARKSTRVRKPVLSTATTGKY